MSTATAGKNTDDLSRGGNFNDPFKSNNYVDPLKTSKDYKDPLRVPKESYVDPVRAKVSWGKNSIEISYSKLGYTSTSVTSEFPAF